MGKMPNIREQIAGLPQGSGVYVFRDAAERILYVGKANNLRRRVSSYFRVDKNRCPRIARMAAQVRTVAVTLTRDENEALVLEARLIQQHRPRYNVRMREGKRYPFLCVTLNEPFPRVIIVSEEKEDGNRYFGPYPKIGALREALRVIEQEFRLRTCDRTIQEGDRQPVCLSYHLGHCPAPCAARIRRTAYLRQVEEACALLEGRCDALLHKLATRREEASAAGHAAKATRLQRQIEAIQTLLRGP